MAKWGTRPLTPSLKHRTPLLVGVADEGGDPVCDHLWLPLGRALAAAGPRVGDVVAFRATVAAYRKRRYLEPDGSITAGALDYGLVRLHGVRALPAANTEGSI